MPSLHNSQSLHSTSSRTAPCQGRQTVQGLTSTSAPSTMDASMQLICFDVDSTLCADESIDEIAAFLGKGEEVAALTRDAMDGSVTFQDALERRLEVMQVSRQDITRFKTQHPPQLNPGGSLVRAVQRSRPLFMALIPKIHS
jgi:phosphoserine phosphatase